MANELSARAYRWFASLFTRELNRLDWGRYRDQTVSEKLRAEFEELGLRPAAQQFLGFIEAYRAEPDEAVVNELATDFSSLFYGPGGGLAPPYQSFYTDSAPRFFGPDHVEVARLLLEERLDLPHGWAGPADHAAIELDLIAHLQSEDHVAAPTESPTRGSIMGPDQAFRHWQVRAMRWILRWSRDVQKHAETDFYSGGAALLDAFLQAELAKVNTVPAGSSADSRDKA